MTTRRAIFFAILVLVLALAAGILLNKVSNVPLQNNSRQELVGGATSSENISPKIAASEIATGSGATDLVEILRVIDGDTIEVEMAVSSTGAQNKERLRYIGMDTPEIVKPVGCFGEEAAAKNKELVEGKTVRLEKDVSERDKYGRLLRYVWVGDTMVNLELVKEGYATAWTYPPDVKYSAEFTAAEKQAREAKLGLWSSCK